MDDDHLAQELANLLLDLSRAQRALLDLLSRKRQALARADLGALQALAPQERRIVECLGECQARRTALLAQAAEHGRRLESLRALAGHWPDRKQLEFRVREATAQSRLLRHQSLTTWLLAQRTLVHLARLLEMLATGGRPTAPFTTKRPRASPSASLPN